MGIKDIRIAGSQTTRVADPSRSFLLIAISLIPLMISFSLSYSEARLFITSFTVTMAMVSLFFISEMQSMIVFSKAGVAGFDTLSWIDLRFAILFVFTTK